LVCTVAPTVVPAWKIQVVFTAMEGAVMIPLVQGELDWEKTGIVNNSKAGILDDFIVYKNKISPQKSNLLYYRLMMTPTGKEWGWHVLIIT